MAEYVFRGCTIRNMGYHQPDHCVLWEATDKDGGVVAHGKTLRECEIIIAEQEAERMLLERIGGKSDAKDVCKTRKLTLDEAIAHCMECADGTTCGENHRQLAEWLKELRALKGNSPEWKAGNAEAMREALEFAERQLMAATENDEYGDDVVYLVGCMRTVASACRAALSLPRRNCDAGSQEEQEVRFKKFCDQFDEDCTGCPCDDGNTLFHCFAKWAQMPYAAERKGEK